MLGTVEDVLFDGKEVCDRLKAFTGGLDCADEVMDKHNTEGSGHLGFGIV